MKQIYLALLLFSHLGTNAQAPSTIWQNSYGGSNAESVYSIKPTPDGGMIMTGFTISDDGQFLSPYLPANMVVIKLDSNGIVEWQKIIGGNSTDVRGNINLTNDGNYNCEVVKLDTPGNILWQKTYGGNNYDASSRLVNTSDVGYIFEGITQSANCWVFEIDNSGNLIWQQCYGGTGSDSGASVTATLYGGYILGSNSISTDGDLTFNHGGFYDYWIVKIGSTGTLEWQKTFDGSAEDQVSRILEVQNGGYIVVGISSSTDGDVTGNHVNTDF